MFVTLKVFKLIGPSNDGRWHGRGTYLFILKHDTELLEVEKPHTCLLSATITYLVKTNINLVPRPPSRSFQRDFGFISLPFMLSFCSSGNIYHISSVARDGSSSGRLDVFEERRSDIWWSVGRSGGSEHATEWAAMIKDTGTTGTTIWHHPYSACLPYFVPMVCLWCLWCLLCLCLLSLPLN
jgi:hypothetical protein